MNKNLLKYIVLLSCALLVGFFSPSFINFVDLSKHAFILFIGVVGVLALDAIFFGTFVMMTETNENAKVKIFSAIQNANPVLDIFANFGVAVLYISILNNFGPYLNIWVLRLVVVLFLVSIVGLKLILKELQCKVFRSTY